MAFENIKAGIALMAEDMVDQPEDRHQVLEQVREKLNELRAMGMPLPQDLVALEESLEAELDRDEGQFVETDGGAKGPLVP